MADAWGFEQTAIPYMPLLYSQAMKLTLNSDDAIDLLKETYLRAYRFWSKFEKGTNVKGWLSRVMKNSYSNLHPQNVEQPKPVNAHETSTSVHSSSHRTFDREYLAAIPPRDDFEYEIVRCVESFQGISKSIVLLGDAEELRYAEMAEMVSCPVGTIRSRSHRNQKSLQKNLLHVARLHGMAS